MLWEDQSIYSSDLCIGCYPSTRYSLSLFKCSPWPLRTQNVPCSSSLIYLFQVVVVSEAAVVSTSAILLAHLTIDSHALSGFGGGASGAGNWGPSQGGYGGQQPYGGAPQGGWDPNQGQGQPGQW